MQSKKIKKYQEETLLENANIILTDSLLNQIDHLHKIVGKVEWSGVLVYRTIKGSIEDYKNFTVEALEIIPMDVGTSGYTEYEIEAADDYVFKNLLERVMLDDELKIGHIHTHHGMECFFSGTDMAELHENAPNHNYYLSLIVNFKDYTQWKAKIAQIKTVKSTGYAVYSYKGTNDLVTEKVSLDGEKEILSMINLDITTASENSISKEFKDRVKELKTNQDALIKKSTSVRGNTNWSGYYNQPSLFETLGESINPNTTTHTEKMTVDVSSKSISDFAIKLISQSDEPLGTLENTLSVLDQVFMTDEGVMDYYIETIPENFDLLFIDHFKTSPSPNSRKLVVVKITEELEKIEEEKAYMSSVVENIVEALNEHVCLEF